MQPVPVICARHMDQLRKTAAIVRYLVETTTPTDARTYRDGGDGWTLLEVLCHLRDFEEIIWLRARLTLEQERPELPFPDPNQLAVERQYNEQDIQAVLAAWLQQRADFLAYLEAVEEAGWQRVGMHPVRGPVTLLDQLMIFSWHDVNHIEQMIKILTERKV
jgi:uncharacterized damage-inducible protein DinB